MLNSPDFKELLSLFKDFNVRFLVIGGYAVMKYTEPRYTKDLDLWIAVDARNAAAVWQALKKFGAPLAGLTEKDFAEPGYFYQMGRPPMRVDIMMSIPGLVFEEAWPNRVETVVGDVVIPFISKPDLIRAKKAAARPQDLLDANSLENQKL
jgi:hypothetical protein